MIIPFRPMLFHSIRIPARGLAAALALLLWAAVAGCKTVEIDAPPAKTDTSTLDSASILISNLIEQDRDSITLFLYSGNAVDFANANRVKRLGGIDSGASERIKVPAGTWKLAYEDHAGVLFPMIDVNAAAQDWLKAIFIKDKNYSLILSSDGNRAIWVPSFQTDPPIE